MTTLKKMEFNSRYQECERCGQLVGWLGILTNTAMAILKAVVGITSGSKACIADALHSASNIITAFAILVSRRYSRRPGDDRYPYGYGKIEFITAAFVSLVIVVVAVLLICVSIKHLLYEPQPPPHLTALLMAVVSVGVNELMFRYFRCVGTQLRSQTIMATAWANRADCFSSLAVIVGVVGSRLGLHHLDPIAALVVVAIIIKVCLGCLIHAVEALMDSSASGVYIEEVRESLKNIIEIRNISYIKARQIGHEIWLDLGIEVSPQCSVSEANVIADSIKHYLIGKMRDVGNVMVELGPASS